MGGWARAGDAYRGGRLLIDLSCLSLLLLVHSDRHNGPRLTAVPNQDTTLVRETAFKTPQHRFL